MNTIVASIEHAFLFVGAKDARLKLAAGWTKIDLASPPSDDDLTVWVAQSHALITAKKPATKKLRARKKPAKKRRKSA